MADNENDVVYFRSGDGTPFTVPFHEAENTYNQGYIPIEDDAEIADARTKLQDARVGEAARGEKAAPPTIEQVLQPYDDQTFKFYKDQGLDDDEARTRAQSSWATNKAYSTIVEADPAFRDAGDIPSTIGAYLEGLGGSATLDTLPFVLGGVGRGLEALGYPNNWLTPEAQELRKQANPGAYRAGEITGFIGPGVSKIGLKVFPRLAQVPAIGKILGAGAAIDTATGGDIAGEVTGRLLLKKGEREVIKDFARSAVANPTVAKAVEKELRDQAVTETLKKLGARGGVIGALEKVGGASAVALGTAAQGAVQGGIYGAMERGTELQRGALSEASAADYVSQMLEGGVEGAERGAAVGGILGIAAPPVINVLGKAVQKTNDLLQYAAREFPVVSVPSLGSVLGRFTKSELQDAMMRDAESKAPAFVERVGKVADAVDDEVNEFLNKRPDIVGEYQRALAAYYGLDPNTPRANLPPQIIAAVNQIDQQIDGAVNALNSSPYRIRNRHGQMVTDRGALENWIGNQRVTPQTETIPLPPEYENLRNIINTHVNGLDQLAEQTRLVGGPEAFGGNMPSDMIQASLQARQGLGDALSNIISQGTGTPIRFQPIAPLPEFPRQFDYLPPNVAAAQYGKQMQAQQAFAGLGQNAPPATFGPISEVNPQALLAQAGTAGGVATAAKVLGSMAGLPATAIGGATAYVGGSLIRPKEVIQTLHLIDLGSQKISQATKAFSANLFGTGVGRAVVGTGVKISGQAGKQPPEVLYSYKDNLSTWNKDSQNLERLSPEDLSIRLSRVSRPLDDFSPVMAQEASLATTNGIKLLRDKQDEIKKLYGYGRPDWTPPPQQALKYARYSNYVRNPLNVLKDTDNLGYVPPEGMEVLQKVYPSMLLEIQTDLVDEYAKAVEQNKTIPEKRMRVMKTLLGEPMVSQQNMQQVKANQQVMQERKAKASGNVSKRMELEQGGLSPRK